MKSAFVQGYIRLSVNNRDMIREFLESIESALDVPKSLYELSAVVREISKLELRTWFVGKDYLEGIR